MNARIGKSHVMSAVVAVMATALTSCAHADSTVTASKEYVNRKVAAALDSVGVAMEDQWMATTNVISASSASATNYVDSATNDVLVAAQGYTDEKISEIPAADFSTNNVELVETIEATAPPPGDYAAVSNAAVCAAITNALQDAAITALGDGKVDKIASPAAGNFVIQDTNGNISDSGVSTNLYLKKTGDTMAGPLDMASYSIHQTSPFGKEYWLYPGKMYMTGGYELEFPIKNGVIATVDDIDSATNDINTVLANKASIADATLTEWSGDGAAGESAWVPAGNVVNPLTAEGLAAFKEYLNPPGPYLGTGVVSVDESHVYIDEYPVASVMLFGMPGDLNYMVILALMPPEASDWADLSQYIGVEPWSIVGVRNINGYVLGSSPDKPIAAEGEVAFLRSSKLDQSDVVAPTTSSSASGKAADAKATGDALAGKAPLDSPVFTGGLTAPNMTVGSREENTTVGVGSVVNGQQNTASGKNCHAEGACTIASAANDSSPWGAAHAEGFRTTASGGYSHAEGEGTFAEGYGAHAEGVETSAVADYSHTEGFETVALNEYEHAAGMFNVSHAAEDASGATLSSIGFGNFDQRKNAVETMRDGKTYIYGLGGYDGTNPTNAQDLATAVALTERKFSEWVCSVQGVSLVWGDSWSDWGGIAGWVLDGSQSSCMPKGSFDSLSIEWTGNEQTFDMSGVTATRTALHGYQLGSQTDKPLASEAEVEALRTGKADKSDLDPLLFAQYYPEGNVKSAAEFTAGIKYDDPDTTNRTITVKPFCNTGTATNDNSSLVGRVVIPPFVDASGNGYISDDGTRFKVVGVSGFSGYLSNSNNTNLTAIIAPNTVTTIERKAFSFCTSLISALLPATTRTEFEVFYYCTSLTSVPLPAATTIGNNAFSYCTSLTSISLPAATTMGGSTFYNCTSLTSISLPAVTTMGAGAFAYCRVLTSVDFGDTPRSSVPSLGAIAFAIVPPACKIIVPYTQYDAWIAADGWRDLPQEFVRHTEKADKPATFTTGNLAKFDAQGNPTDSGVAKSDVESLFFAQYYPEGNVKSAAEFTPGIKYTLTSNATERTATVKPFSNTGNSANDNSGLEGRVVLPPFVDGDGNGYISDDGTRYKVVGVSNGAPEDFNRNLTAIIAPTTVTSVNNFAFGACLSLTSVSLPAATSIGAEAFSGCTSLVSVSLPSTTSIGSAVFSGCTSLASVHLPAMTSTDDGVFSGCTSLASVDFGATARSSVPSLGNGAFYDVPTTCKIIVPDAQYDAWTAETLPYEFPNPWYDLVTAGYKFLRHSEWEYARKYELDGKLDKMKPVAWSELKTLRDSGSLVPGQQYRITNYVATTYDDLWSRSANLPFDIIVIADSITNLSEHARAAVHEGDTYFASSNLEAWDVWYCLDNDSNRFSWADNANGKGVIYRLVDEWQNDVPYDFKGIQFVAYPADEEEDYVFRYTFDSGDDVDNFDCSIAPNSDLGAMENKIGPYREGSRALMLNYIVFKGGYCIGNTIEDDCSYVTFGSNSMYNVIGRYGYQIEFGGDCHYNTLAQFATECTLGGGCSYNSLGNNCQNIILGASCGSNVFGAKCEHNTLGSSCNGNAFAAGCHNNTLGNSCNRNAMGPGCAAIAIKVNGNDNTFGSYCRYITLWDGSGRNSFGNGCESINVGKQFGGSCFNNSFDNGSNNIRIGNNSDNNHFGAGVNHVVFGSADTPAATSNYYSSVSVESGNRYIYLVCTTNVTSSAPYRNIAIRRGVNKTSTYKTIADPNGNQSFETVYRAAGSLDIEVQ